MSTTSHLNENQRELVDLLVTELTSIVEAELDYPVEGDAELDQRRLQDYQIHSENIGNAAAVIGLVGLSDCCRHMSNNFILMIERQKSSPDEQRPDIDTVATIRLWSMQLLNYLQHLEDEETTLQTVEELIEFLQSPHWPEPISAPEIETITERFAHSHVVLDDCQGETETIQADAEMVSLQGANDLRSELVEGFLLELPIQIQEFSNAIIAFVKTRESAYLQLAQRVAHTIKGAANVVSVKGVANLMHYSEEILHAISKGKARLSTELLQLIQDASDCLETMGEYLLDMGEEPLDSLSVLQRLIDFNQAPTKEIAPTPPPDQESRQIDTLPPESVIAPSQQPITDSGSILPQLRVPDQLISDLLRLAEESFISNTRVQSQTQQLRNDLTQIANFHQQLLKMVQSLEQQIDINSVFTQNTGPVSPNKFDPLELEHYNELHSFSHRLLEIATDSAELVAEVRSNLDQFNLQNLEQSKLNRENQQLLLRTRMVEINSLASRFHRCVRQTSRLTGHPARLTILGGEILLDSRLLSELTDSIMHLLRNAVDHGVEPNSLRQAAGKDPEGNITLAFYRKEERIRIQCHDDGSGLDLEQIKTRALEQGLISDQANDEELKRLILTPGLSTRDKISQTSGRGIGLDIVESKIRTLNGKLDIESEKGKGTSITLTLPANLLSAQALTVSVGHSRVAIVTRGIDQIVYLSPGDLRPTDTSSGTLVTAETRYSYNYQNQSIPVYDFNQILSLPPTQAQPVMLLLEQNNGNYCGVVVERVLTSQEVIVKPLNRFTYKPAGVIGATISGNGIIYAVMDLSELIATMREKPQTAFDIYPSHETADDVSDDLKAIRKPHKVEEDEISDNMLPIALIVDDSLSSRRSLAQFLSDMGFATKTAKDGFEAIDLINEKVPALILVDLEMPRMNGLELTEHLRSKENTRNLPVIMITSRTTQKHRHLASAAGVNSYISKPFSEDELLHTIEEHMGNVQKQIAC